MNRATRKINKYKRTSKLKDLCISVSIVKVNNKSILKKISFLMRRSFHILTFLSLYKFDTLNNSQYYVPPLNKGISHHIL